MEREFTEDLATPDPSLRFFIRRREPTEPISGSATNDNNSGIDHNELPPPPAGMAVPQPAVNKLAVLAKLVKDSKKFKNQTEAEFENYTTLQDIEERLLVQFAVALEVRDLLKEVKSAQHASWTLSKELKDSIKYYTNAFLLSPTLKSYRGNGAEYVLKVMRELGVPSLPSEKQALQVSEVVSAIGKQMTTHRGTIKAKIDNSLTADSPLQNIADLTHSLLSHLRIQPTLQHYLRFAFLRFVLKNYPHINPEDYWLQVDIVLEQFMENAATATELTEAFNNCYQDDKTEYGDPAESRYTVVEPKEVEEWCRTLDKHAGATQVGPKELKSKKRKHL